MGRSPRMTGTLSGRHDGEAERRWRDRALRGEVRRVRVGGYDKTAAGREDQTMHATHALMQLLIQEAAVAWGRRERAARTYDPYTLATRPLPARLAVYPHPRRLSAEAVRRILGRPVSDGPTS